MSGRNLLVLAMALAGCGSSAQPSYVSDWTKEKTFNTPWVRWSDKEPFVVEPGDRFHLTCTWDNEGPKPIGFPREMCVASGFMLEAGEQAICDASGS